MFGTMQALYEACGGNNIECVKLYSRPVSRDNMVSCVATDFALIRSITRRLTTEPNQRQLQARATGWQTSTTPAANRSHCLQPGHSLARHDHRPALHNRNQHPPRRLWWMVRCARPDRHHSTRAEGGQGGRDTQGGKEGAAQARHRKQSTPRRTRRARRWRGQSTAQGGSKDYDDLLRHPPMSAEERERDAKRRERAERERSVRRRPRWKRRRQRRRPRARRWRRRPRR